jgi:AcrR family transcriptional regulator
MPARIPNERSKFECSFGKVTDLPMSTEPPTRPALRARYERRRREVVDAAAEVFAQRGFHATSVQDLVAATGLAAGGLYHYIGSKDQLLVQICDELMDPLLEEADALCARDDLDAEARLRALVRAWVAHVERHLDHMRVFAQERHVIEGEPQWRTIRAKRKAFERVLDDALADVERAGVTSLGDRRLALLALLGMVNYTPQWYRPRGRLGADAIADGFCDILLRPSPAPDRPARAARRPRRAA